MSTVIPSIAPASVDLPVAGGTLTVAQILLPGVPRGAVVLLREEHGTDGRMAVLMNALAEHGYESFAADLATLSSEPLSDEAALAALGDLVAHVGSHGWTREQTGVVGYGFGGRLALLAASRTQLGAAVSVSPEGVGRSTPGRPALVDAVPAVVTPWLGMFGAVDDLAPADDVRTLAKRLVGPSPQYSEVVTYPGVGGLFFHESAEALAHAAMFDSWQRVVEWLNLRVVPRPTPYAEIWSLKQALGE
ncbi:dienelactone hydrolase family protein [Nocardioides acrostichi]|uniref:Dienelactone hydrolase family protein n=1 Tax=Nocardioides acrostichi TaxID=2784339 RepID=A0A930V2U8_9ACTN|nr:dienelactone hydrolase family protein [Nocardioides acrostichi]MBF4162735.1 dienelactone hydrolase family protein [Nocardioides acrostichi]